MIENKKAFKDWDISDFKDFTDMGGMQKFEESRKAVITFNRIKKGSPRIPYESHPVSNLADVL